MRAARTVIFCAAIAACAPSDGPNWRLTAPPQPPPTGLLLGRVTAADGTALADVVVRADADHHDPIVAFTAADGRYELRVPPGTWKVTFELGGQVLSRGEAVLERTGAPVMLDAQLPAPALPPAAASICGVTVDDEGGGALAGSTVVASSPELPGTRAEITGDDGAYCIAGLPAGTYQIHIYYAEAEVERHDVAVRTGAFAQVNARIPMQRGEMIVVTDKVAQTDQRGDQLGASFSGSSSVENHYVVDGINTTNVPTRGRTYEGRLGSAAGSQGDTTGTTFGAGKGKKDEKRGHRPTRKLEFNGLDLQGRTRNPQGGKEEDDDKDGFDEPSNDRWTADEARAALMLADADEVWVIARASTSAGGQAPRQAGQLLARRGDQEVPMPLEQTDVHADVAGYIASVEVAQRYRNPFAEKIEAVYVFPLPEDAAVSDFVMTIGDRKIRGIVRDRAEAEEIYAEARSAGYQAALMTEERPNIFTQRVANIEPGKVIDVTITYYGALPYRDGEYTLVFPTVVGPRFNPPGTTDGVGAVPRGASGASGQGTEVAYLAPGEKTRHRVSIQVDLDAGVPIQDVRCDTHRVTITSTSPSRRRIVLSDGGIVADRDFVLRYKVAGEELASGLLTGSDATGQYVALVLQPPAVLAKLERTPVEMVFVIDASGSMSGAPITRAKQAVAQALRRLGPQDSFQIIQFSESAYALGRAPIAATPENVARGLRWLEKLQGEGGTEMIEGIKASLDFPHDPHRFRLVSFMTDGYIGNEAEILAAIHARLGASRIFSFGVGTSVNRYLIEQMAVAGRGAVAYVDLDSDSGVRAVDSFYQRIAHPALADVQLDLGQYAELYPSQIPDVFVGRPVLVVARVAGKLGAAATVRGSIGGQPVAWQVPLATARATSHPALAKVWARSKIADLSQRAIYTDDVRPLAMAVKETALRYGLLSPFTAFVAVDASRRTAGDHGHTVVQPVDVPAGVSYDTTVGGE